MRFKEFNTQSQIPLVGRKDLSKIPPELFRKTQDANKIATQKATQGTNPAVAGSPNQKVGQQPTVPQKTTVQPSPTMPTIPKDIILPTGTTVNSLTPQKVEPEGNDIILTPVNKKPGEKTISTKISRQEFLATLAALQGKQTP